MLTNSEAAWLAARTQNRLMKDLIALPILSAPQPRSAAKPPVVPDREECVHARRRPVPVNTSTRCTGSGLDLCESSVSDTCPTVRSDS